MSSTMTVADFLQKVGMQILPDPYDSVYSATAINNNPQHGQPSTPALIEACLRYRGIIYWKKNPGDCGNAVRPTIGGEQLAAKGLGSAASADPEPISGSILGVASLITGIFGAHHAAAVKTEQQTICDVTGKVNAALPQIDNFVVSQQVSAQDGISMVQNLMQPLIAELGTIRKDCNAACIYTAVLQAHMDFARAVYPSMATNGTPTGVKYQAPGSSLAALGLPKESAVFGAAHTAMSPWVWIGIAFAVGVLLLAITLGRSA